MSVDFLEVRAIFYWPLLWGLELIMLKQVFLYRCGYTYPSFNLEASFNYVGILFSVIFVSAHRFQRFFLWLRERQMKVKKSSLARFSVFSLPLKLLTTYLYNVVSGISYILLYWISVVSSIHSTRPRQSLWNRHELPQRSSIPTLLSFAVKLVIQKTFSNQPIFQSSERFPTMMPTIARWIIDNA